MWLLEVLIEHASLQLDRPFTYVYEGQLVHRSGFRVLVPFNNQSLVGYVLSSSENQKTLAELQKESAYRLHPVSAVIDDEPLLTGELMEVAATMATANYVPRISILQAMLPPSLKPRSSALKKPAIAYEYFIKVANDDEGDLTLKQIEWLRVIKREQPFPKRDCRSPAILKVLMAKGRVSVYPVEKRRYKLPDVASGSTPELTKDQQKAVTETLASTDQVFLLQGVTGSGKTEVYLTLSETILSQGKAVIMVVPEIALTPMMVQYFMSRFKEHVAILHSELTPAEKYDEYRRIRSGKARIVIGARSAIFAPLEDIGLIILDEEHVETYKQDTPPFYHARDVAFLRGKLHHAKVVLGSATPSLESRARAEKGVYHLLKLPQRINAQPLPKTDIIDMLDVRNIDRESSLFSLQLRKSMAETLSRGEQAILLINRRGYAPSISCRSCGHVFKCPTCEVALTYHRRDGMLKCHHCDHLEPYPRVCPKCNSPYLMLQGFGTERIHEETKRLYPQARILVLDSDAGKVRNTIAKTLAKFANREADILIGTQMVAKGHDFPSVTLVGLVLADVGLTLPSFRSSERTFQLIIQAVGRSGRSDRPGSAIIQTYAPTHYAVTLGAKQDYETFFLQEMKQRRLADYPPYCHLLTLTISGQDEELVIDSIAMVHHMLKNSLPDSAALIGPASPFISRQGATYRRHLLIKLKRLSDGGKPLQDIIAFLRQKSMLKTTINLNPYDV